jgi:hypothetical protein
MPYRQIIDFIIRILDRIAAWFDVGWSPKFILGDWRLSVLRAI